MKFSGIVIGAIALLMTVPAADAAQTTVVALGASQTFGKGVARSESYPAQLEQLLRADGINARVLNLGINGDTTEGMLRRVSAVPKGAKVVILQPGGNDKRMGQLGDRGTNISQIESRLQAQGATIVMLENAEFRNYERGPDGQHLTPSGYHQLAQSLLPQVESALGH